MAKLPQHPDDIANSKRKSGYDHVNAATGGMGNQAHLNFARSPRWRASWNKPGGGKNDKVRGKCRSTALEAAWDYIRHINKWPQAVKTPAYPAPTIDMGGTTRHAPATPSITVKRTEWKGATDVYDVLLYDPHNDDLVMRRKVGITAKGDKRYADICATFGWSIKAHRRAVTYKTKAAATKAETALIQAVAADPGWVQVGKESFAPVNKQMKVSA